MAASEHEPTDPGDIGPAVPDQQPVDQQPISRSERAVPSAEPNDAPRLPGDLSDTPAIASRSGAGPSIPPLQNTAPPDLVVEESTAMSRLEAMGERHQAPADTRVEEFSPLRADSPPPIVPTWWLRYALAILMPAAIAAAMWTEYRGAAGDVRRSAIVLGLHVASIVVLVSWSVLTMSNAGRIVPPTRYHAASRGWLAAVLWLAALSAPAWAAAGYQGLRDRLDDPDDLAAVFILSGIVLTAFVVVWLPFRYHTRQASRIGAPHRVMTAWFWAPMLAAVCAIATFALGLRDLLADEGLTEIERTIQLGVVYGMPTVLFALSTWRAVTVFDEVLELRWHRWKAEWEQTLEALTKQPAPGPEDSPHIDATID